MGGNNQIWAKIIVFQDVFKSQPAANKLKLVAFPNQVQNLILKQVLPAGHGNAFPYSESERQLLSTFLDHRSSVLVLRSVRVLYMLPPHNSLGCDDHGVVQVGHGFVHN